MTELEQLAKEAFDRYSALIGQKANWIYLSSDRKVAWMKEVIFLSDFFADKMKEKFRKVPVLDPNAGSFAAGYNQGMQMERSATLNFIDYIDIDLKEQLEQYLEIQDKLSKQD